MNKKYFLEYGQICKGNEVLEESEVVKLLNDFETENTELKESVAFGKVHFLLTESAELKAENERLIGVCGRLAFEKADISNERNRLRNLPNEILAELQPLITEAYDGSCDLLYFEDVKKICAKFAQENGDILNKGGNEND